jgi:hypothetical protein
MNYYNSSVPPPNYYNSSVPPPHLIPLRTPFITPPSLNKHILFERYTDFLAELVAAKVLSQNRKNTNINTVFENPKTFIRICGSSGTNISFIMGTKRVRTYHVYKIEKTWYAEYIGKSYPVFQCVDAVLKKYHFNIKLYIEQNDRRTWTQDLDLGPVNRVNTPYRRR